MDGQWLLSFVLFALSMSITPGPNNFMVLATATNADKIETVKQIIGISCGFLALLILAIVGIAELLINHPLIYSVIKYLGVLYLIYLSFKVFSSQPDFDAKNTRIYGFFEVFWLQFANPKGWMMAVGTSATFLPKNIDIGHYALVVGLLFTLINIFSNSVWAFFGLYLKRFLTHPQRLKHFNILITMLLLASVVLIVVG